MSKEYTLRAEIDFGPDGKKLIPVAVQDAVTGEILILAFANLKALETTREKGLATFWSRSRNELWTKGLSSGDTLKIEEIRINCEQNSLLYRVTPQGTGACHAKKADGTSHTSCYYRRLENNNTLTLLEE